MKILSLFNTRIRSAGIIMAFWLVTAGNSFSGSGDINCLHCGMLKSKFGHSWVILETDDGKRAQVCSIHCAAIDMVVNRDWLISRITVGDFTTHKQIDAYKAYWVIGGDLPGVMTLRAKWAFEKKEAAQTFIRLHGGREAVFEEVIRAAFVDLYEDTMEFKRRKMLLKEQKKEVDKLESQ